MSQVINNEILYVFYGLLVCLHLFIHEDVHLIRRNFASCSNNCSENNLINNKIYIKSRHL